LDENGFLAMGGYAGYVWPAYLAAALVLGALALASLRRLARVRRTLAGLESDGAAPPAGAGEAHGRVAR
jgi:heme exporter protein D